MAVTAVRLPAALYDLSMRLASLRIEGYSGIRSASLQLEHDITAVVGENDSGKRRLLEALDAVLGGEPDRGPPRFEGGSSVRVALEFEEREPGEWSDEAHAPLHPSLGAAGPARRRLTLEAGDGSWALVGADGARRSEPELLTWLRRRNPVFSLRRGTWSEARRGAWAGPQEAEALVEEVVKCASDLLDGRAADPEREVERGFAAAAEVIERAHQHLDSRQPALHPVITEVMGHVPAGVGHAADRMARVGDERRAHGRPLRRRGPAEGDRKADRAGRRADPRRRGSRGLHARYDACRRDAPRRADPLAAHPDDGVDRPARARSRLAKVRRLVRHADLIYECRIDPGTLSPTDLRRVTYHLRERRGQAMFSRCWLLVEGESEAWLLPELARLCGYELVQEGIALVEYAQAGLDPAIRTADGLGIEWHVLADGDEAGRVYRALAESYCGADPSSLRVTALEEPDLELFLWHHGYDEVYKHVAEVGTWGAAMPPRRVIRRAIDRASKPMLALEVLSAIAERGEEGVPAPLRQLIDTCVTLAREAPARQAARRGA